jgi:hypothetical protein
MIDEAVQDVIIQGKTPVEHRRWLALPPALSNAYEVS